MIPGGHAIAPPPRQRVEATRFMTRFYMLNDHMLHLFHVPADVLEYKKPTHLAQQYAARFLCDEPEETAQPWLS